MDSFNDTLASLTKFQKCYFWKIDELSTEPEDAWTPLLRKIMLHFLTQKVRMFDPEHEVSPDTFKHLHDGNSTFATIQILESLLRKHGEKNPCTTILKLFNSGEWMIMSWLYYHHNWLCVFGVKQTHVDNTPSIVWDESTWAFEPKVRTSTKLRLDLGTVTQKDCNVFIAFIKLPVITAPTDDYSSDDEADEIIAKYKKSMDDFITSYSVQSK